MQRKDFHETVEAILRSDHRYQADAYHFVREALEHTQKAVSKANKGQLRHISGQELLKGIRAYALAQYGPMALFLLHEWGVRACEDFGEIVFRLAEHGSFSTTENDRRTDFQGGYDFQQAFRQPFLPTRHPGAAPTGPHPNPAPSTADS
ncbi:MAG: hypothetical protein FJ387_09495 [Verrucomicrobia bacterium]|nr:hypothetical protein [Verrucomicrobiota bacterium]